MVEPAPSRRPLRTRESAWAKSLAARLTRSGVSPNAISLASVGFAALAAASFLIVRDTGQIMRCLLLAGAAIAIQLRLLCNMIDGMVAVEGSRATKTGEVFNDAPDRVADMLIFVAAGYGIMATDWAPAVGWAAALFAVLTAYVRMLGGTLGLQQDFCGPMAKQHRMAAMTIGCGAAIIETLVSSDHGWSMLAALVLIAVGSAFTAARRLWRILRSINAG